MAATYVPVRWTDGRAPGSTTRACTSSWALSDTRRRRNHVQKTVGEPYAGEPLVRIERGMGNRARKSTAPLTTSAGPHVLHRDCRDTLRGLGGLLEPPFRCP